MFTITNRPLRFCLSHQHYSAYRYCQLTLNSFFSIPEHNYQEIKCCLCGTWHNRIAFLRWDSCNLDHFSELNLLWMETPIARNPQQNATRRQHYSYQNRCLRKLPRRLKTVCAEYDSTRIKAAAVYEYSNYSSGLGCQDSKFRDANSWASCSRDFLQTQQQTV
jgi:hypothetical protein